MKRSLHLALSALIAITVGVLPGEAGSQNYQHELTRGLYQMVKKDYQSAVASFTQVLMYNPEVYEAYLNRGIARIELKDLDGALNDFNQAIKINQNVIDCYIKRGDLRLKMGDTQDAITDYTQALRLNPRYMEGYLKRAAAYKQVGEYTKASADFSSAINLDSTLIDAMAERADCKVKALDLDGAIDEYSYLFKKYKSKTQNLHYNLGEVLMLKGDKETARVEFNEAIAYQTKKLKQTRKDGKAYLARGLAYAQIGDLDKAIADLEEAAAWKEDDATISYQLGHLRLAKGKAKEAIEALDDALRLDAKHSEARMDRAAANVALGQFADAQKDLDAALEGKKTAAGHLNRAMARLALGDSSGAVNDIQEARVLNPRVLELHKKDLSERVAKKEAASENDLELSVALQQLALFALSDNNIAEAETLVKRSISLQEKQLGKNDPKLAFSLMMLGRVYMKQKANAKAEAIFRSAFLKLKNNPDGAQKYAIFNLEDLAKALIQTSSLEEAGAILIDTRHARSTSALNERAFLGELSRKADRAIEAHKQQLKRAQQKAEATEVAKENTESQPVSVRTVTDVQRNSERPIRDKWAVIVGISNFKDSNINLHFCAKDAKDFHDFLINEKNFAPDHVKLLTDSMATRANILSLLGNKWLPRVAEPDDLVVIYFSSHGSPSSLDVGGVNYLVAHDTDVNDLYATGIAMQDLSRIIKERVHCERIMIVLDACHSGVAAPSAKGLVRPRNVDVDSIVQGTGQLVLSSSSPDQSSWESKRYAGSVFTRHLIEGLRKNGKLTRLDDAFAYLNEEVQREVLRDRGVLQNPVMKSKWEGSALILGVTPKAPSGGLPEVELPDSIKNTARTEAKAPDSHKEAGKIPQPKPRHRHR